MDQVTQQNAALVEEMAAAASSLRGQAQDLVGTVAVFKLSTEYEKPRAPAAPSPTSQAAAAPKVTSLASAKPLRSLKAGAPRSPVAPRLAMAAAGQSQDWESF
jgi:hypothetical protein